MVLWLERLVASTRDPKRAVAKSKLVERIRWYHAERNELGKLEAQQPQDRPLIPTSILKELRRDLKMERRWKEIRDVAELSLPTVFA